MYSFKTCVYHILKGFRKLRVINQDKMVYFLKLHFINLVLKLKKKVASMLLGSAGTLLVIFGKKIFIGMLALS